MSWGCGQHVEVNYVAIWRVKDKCGQCLYVKTVSWGTCIVHSKSYTCTMHIYIYIYTHTHTHTYIYIYIYTHTHAHIYTLLPLPVMHMQNMGVVSVLPKTEKLASLRYSQRNFRPCTKLLHRLNCIGSHLRYIIHSVWNTNISNVEEKGTLIIQFATFPCTYNSVVIFTFFPYTSLSAKQ